jgi:hypothetical protein
MKILLIILTSIFLFSCSGNYEQRYDKYADFEKVNLRNKGWFPDIVSSDAYDLKSDSYLDDLCAFGMYNYSNNNYYDSAFTIPSARQIDFSVFAEKVKINESRRPSWFLDLNSISKVNFETIRIERFYIARDKTQKKIYFVLSN